MPIKLNSNWQESMFYKNTDIELPRIKTDGATSDLIYPFEVRSGFINVTEQGAVFNPNPEDYARFERIFTGDEAISVIWENSTDTYTTGNLEDQTIRLHKRFKPGFGFRGLIDTEAMSNTIGTSTTNQDFQKEYVSSSMSFFTKRQFSSNDVLKLYAIPSKGGKTLYYISNVETFYKKKDGSFNYSLVNFESINDRLAGSGVSVDQYVHFSAPGEGYAYPQQVSVTKARTTKTITDLGRVYNTVADIPSPIENNVDYIIREFLTEGEVVARYNGTTWSVVSNASGYIIDQSSLINKPIKSWQFEIYGPGILSSAYVKGRPIVNGSAQDEIIEFPRDLLNGRQLIPVPLEMDPTRPFVPTDTFYHIQNAQIDIESSFSDWKTEKLFMKGESSETIKWTGGMKIYSGKSEVNQELDNELWRNRINEKNLVHPSNQQLGNNVIQYKWLLNDNLTVRTYNNYIGQQKKVLADFTSDNGEVFWSMRANNTVSSVLNSGYLQHIQTPILPNHYSNTTINLVKDTPIVGGMFGIFTAGSGAYNRDRGISDGIEYNVTGLIPSNVLDYYQNVIYGRKKDVGGTYYAYIPLDAFNDEEVPLELSKSDFSSVFKFDLTDRFVKGTTHANGSDSSFDKNLRFFEATPRMDTVDVGFQSDLDDDNPSKALYTKTSMPIDSTRSFSIDLFGFHFAGQADIRVTFFDVDGNPAWVGSYKSLSKVTKNIRNWNTTVKTSFWNSDVLADWRTEDTQIGEDTSRDGITPSYIPPINPGLDLSNGMSRGIAIPIPKTDENGEVVYDFATGKPQYLYDEQGVQLVRIGDSTDNPDTPDEPGPANPGGIVLDPNVPWQPFVPQTSQGIIRSGGPWKVTEAVSVLSYVPQTTLDTAIANEFGQVRMEFTVNDLSVIRNNAGDSMLELTDGWTVPYSVINNDVTFSIVFGYQPVTGQWFPITENASPYYVGNASDTTDNLDASMSLVGDNIVFSITGGTTLPLEAISTNFSATINSVVFSQLDVPPDFIPPGFDEPIVVPAGLGSYSEQDSIGDWRIVVPISDTSEHEIAIVDITDQLTTGINIGEYYELGYRNMDVETSNLSMSDARLTVTFASNVTTERYQLNSVIEKLSGTIIKNIDDTYTFLINDTEQDKSIGTVTFDNGFNTARWNLVVSSGRLVMSGVVQNTQPQNFYTITYASISVPSYELLLSWTNTATMYQPFFGNTNEDES